MNYLCAQTLGSISTCEFVFDGLMMMPMMIIALFWGNLNIYWVTGNIEHTLMIFKLYSQWFKSNKSFMRFKLWLIYYYGLNIVLEYGYLINMDFQGIIYSFGLQC